MNSVNRILTDLFGTATTEQRKQMNRGQAKTWESERPQECHFDKASANPDAKSLFSFGFSSALNTAVNAAEVTGHYRKDLNAAVSDRPMMLIALDAHSTWVNSKALEVASIDKNIPDPLPGVHYYQRDENGQEVAQNIQQKRRAFASGLVDVPRQNHQRRNY